MRGKQAEQGQIKRAGTGNARRRRSLHGRLCRFVFISLLALLFLILAFGERWFRSPETKLGRKLFAGRETEPPCRSDEFTPGIFPLFLQEDERWANTTYGSGPMKETGCGPTCLSMIVCDLQENDSWTPPRMAEWAMQSGYYVEGAGTAWSMMVQGAEEFGLHAREIPLDEGKIHKQLQKGHPIICTMGPGQFTTEGHYIVLYGEDESGYVKIRDPKSRENSEKNWKLADIITEIKNLWSYTM